MTEGAKVLVIGSCGDDVSDSLTEQICSATGFDRSEIVFASKPEESYRAAKKHRLSLELVVLLTSYSEAMFHDLLMNLHGGMARIVAFFSNHKRFVQLERMCAVAEEVYCSAKESLEMVITDVILKGKVAEAITRALTTQPTATAIA